MNQFSKGDSSRNVRYERLPTLIEGNSEPGRSGESPHETAEEDETTDEDKRFFSEKDSINLEHQNHLSSSEKSFYGKTDMTLNSNNEKTTNLISSEFAFFFTMSYLLGMALTNTPFILRFAGWSGVGVIALVAMIIGYTTQLTLKGFVDTRHENPNHFISFPTVRQNQNVCWSNFIIVFYLLYLTLTLITVLLETSNTILDLLTEEHIDLKNFISSSGKRVTVTAIGCLLFPLSLLRSPKKYSWLAVFTLIFTVVAGLLLTTMLGNLESKNPRYVDSKGVTGIDYAIRISTGVCNLIRFFGLHGVLATIFADMRDPESAPKAVATGFIIPTLFVVVVAMMSYFAFGENISQNLYDVLDKARATHSSTFLTASTYAVKSFLALQMCYVYLLTINALNIFFEKTALTSENNCHCCLIRMFTSTMVILLAVAASDLSQITTFLNTVLACFLCVINPLVVSVNSKTAKAHEYVFCGLVILLIVLCLFGTSYGFVIFSAVSLS